MKTVLTAVSLLLGVSAALAQAPAPGGSATLGASVSAQAPAAGAFAPGEGPVLARGGHAHLRPGAALRARSQADEDPIEGADENTLLTLKVVLKKGGLNWWYVTSDGASGWVLDSDLSPAE